MSDDTKFILRSLKKLRVIKFTQVYFFISTLFAAASPRSDCGISLQVQGKYVPDCQCLRDIRNKDFCYEILAGRVKAERAGSAPPSGPEGDQGLAWSCAAEETLKAAKWINITLHQCWSLIDMQMSTSN